MIQTYDPILALDSRKKFIRLVMVRVVDSHNDFLGSGDDCKADCDLGL